MSATDPDTVFYVNHARLLTAARMVEAVRPSNWDDDEDPDQVAAWSALEESLRPFARAPGDCAPGMDGWDLTTDGCFVSANGWGVAFVFAVGVLVGAMFL